MRLNPRYPRWYDDYVARILFLLGRYEEAAAMLRRKTCVAPARTPAGHGAGGPPRAAIWGGRRRPAAARAGLSGGREVLARRSGGGPREYVDWFVDVTSLKRVEDEERLRDGLRAAGLPA